MVILVIAGYALLLAYEMVPLYKQKMWRDFWANAALGILSFSVALLLSLDVKIPSPERPVRDFITSIFGR